jgi:hypothetical protein
MTKMVRKQFFITEEQNRKLKEQSAAIGVSEADLIRSGIDLRLEQVARDQRAWKDVVNETISKLSGAWAERENLHEEMRVIRRSWNRRSLLMGKGWRRGS